MGSDRLEFKSRIDRNDSIYAKIARFIKSVMPDVYKECQILDIHSCHDGKYYVARTDSTFCMNIARNHCSNTIYFLINEYGIYQKCFCQCPTTVGRRFGLCKEYSSKIRPLKSELQALLFPHISEHKKAVICELKGFEVYDENENEYMSSMKDYLGYLEDEILEKDSYEQRFNSKKKRKY